MGATRMSNPTPNLMFHLMRKEWRQLAPLIAMLGILGFAFHLLNFTVVKLTHDASPLGIVALLGMPSLFAVGLGAILVGQEKDLRTILWLRSLPIRRSDIVKSKLIVALTSIVMIWLLSAALYFAGEIAIGQGMLEGLKESGLFHSKTTLILWPLNTVWLTIVGVAMAWKFKSSFMSLIALVPIAFIPWILAYSSGWSIDLFPGSDTYDWLVLLMLSVGTVVFAWYGWRTGNAFLGPDPSPRANQYPSTMTARPNESRPWMFRQTQSQSFALKRQFAMQNRGLLIGLALTIFIGTALPMVLPEKTRRQDEWSVLCFFLAGLATCWLGVVSFHGDKLNQRIRFLADRGVSPSLVWRTRHALPLAILFAASLTAMALMLLTGHSPMMTLALDSLMSRSKLALLMGGGILLVAIGCYSFSQWVGQVVRSPIVAAIIAPAFSWLMAFVGAVAYDQLGASVLALAFAAMIPLFATWWLMKLWMDGSDGWWFKLRHFLWLGICAVLLISTFVFEYATKPGMPTSVGKQISRTVTGPTLPRSQGSNEAVWQQPGIFGQTDGPLSIATSVKAADSVRDYRQTLIKILQEGARTSSFVDSGLAQTLVGLMLLDRLTLTESPDSTNQEKYRQSVELLVQSIIANRSFLGLYEQEVADGLEISLLLQMKKEDARKNFGDELWNQCCDTLANAQNRDYRRRCAIAAAWRETSINPINQVGKIDRFFLPDATGKSSRSSIRSSILRSRVQGQAIAHLWAILEAKNDAEVLQAKQVVAADWNKPFIDGDEMMDPYQQFNAFQFPGRSWRGKWEKMAAELRTSETQTVTPKSQESKPTSEGQNE